MKNTESDITKKDKPQAMRTFPPEILLFPPLLGVLTIPQYRIRLTWRVLIRISIEALSYLFDLFITWVLSFIFATMIDYFI